MAVARVFRGKGWTTRQYDDLIDRMELGDRSADGVLFHWAAQTEEGVLAVDVYESEEAADALVAEKVGPISAELGLAPPEVTQHDVHRILTP